MNNPNLTPGRILLDMHIDFNEKYPVLKITELDTSSREEVITECLIHNIYVSYEEDSSYSYSSYGREDLAMNISLNYIKRINEIRNKL